MQHRYKINSSNEARKSSTNMSQSHKNDTLSYINLLDKCTQILRQDRIWIRNQLKANDEQLYRIFKQAKRPLNLQHLQIRLRKHVTAVKSKAKMEQLMKFKQNMHLGEWTQPDEKVTQGKPQMQRYHLPPSQQSSATQARGLKARMNNSVDKQTKPNMIYPYRNTSANPKKNLEPFPAPMEQITQRQSQNMTSARHRAFADDIAQNGSFTHNYQQWKRPQQTLSASALNSNFVNDPFKPKPTNGQPQKSNTYFNNFILTENQKQQKQKPKPLLNLGTQQVPRPPISFPASAVSPTGIMKPQNFSKANQSSVNSKAATNNMKKSNKFSKEPEQHEHFAKQELSKSRDSKQTLNGQSFINCNNYFEDYSPNGNPQKSLTTNVASTNFLDTLKPFDQKYTKISQQAYQKEVFIKKSYTNTITNTVTNTVTNSVTSETFKMTSNCDQTDLLHSKHSIPFSSNTNTDSLFTSPQLLAECRNFLKLKSSAKPSIQKDYNPRFTPLQFETKFQPLKFDHIDSIKVEPNKQYLQHQGNSHSQSSMLHIFNQINCGMTNSISNSHLANQPTCSFPSGSLIANTPNNTIVQDQKMKKQVITNIPSVPLTVAAAHQEYFHTFAAMSSQKKPEQICEVPSPQAFIDLVFEHVTNQPEGFIYWQTLQKLVSSRIPTFMQTCRQYLYPSQNQNLVLISNIGRLLEDQCQPQSECTQNQVRCFYRLLDIQQKGYILEQDIEDFLKQLEDSEAEDIQTISDYIWKLFDSIDEDVEESEGKRIDYWGIYAKKNSLEFREVNQILKQFQFQIE